MSVTPYSFQCAWWLLDSRSKIEKLGRAYRKSVLMPLHHAAVLCTNPLNGIVYEIPGEIQSDLEDAIITHLQPMGSGLSPEEQLYLMELVHVCAGRYASKVFDPLRLHGIKPLFPFLEPGMLTLSTSLTFSEKYENRTAKALLKRLLARSIPEKYINRPKSAFVAPFKEMLTYPSMQEFINGVVVSPGNPVFDFCRKDYIDLILARAREGKPLSYGVYDFLWAFIFTSGWLSQLDF